MEALRSQLEAQARRALAESQEQHDAAMSAYQAHLDSAHIAELVAQLQARHVTEASQSCKRHADAQAQHDSDMQALKAEHVAIIEKVHAKAESAMSAHSAQLSALQESLAQHESQAQIAQAEHEANIHALEAKHSGAIAKAQTEVDTLTAQNAAAAEKALTQHEADVHALIVQREATDRAAKEVSVSETKLRKKCEAALAQAQRTHANILLSRMSEVRAQHRSELADLRAAPSDNKIHHAHENQRAGTHEPQNLLSQLTNAQSNMDHHILKRTQEGKLPSALLTSICVAFVKILAPSQPANTVQ